MKGTTAFFSYLILSLSFSIIFERSPKWTKKTSKCKRNYLIWSYVNPFHVMNNYNFELVHACSFIGLNLSFFLFSCCLCPSNRWHIELHFFICGSFFWLSAFWNMNMISFLFGIVFSPALFIVPFEIIIFMIRFNTENFRSKQLKRRAMEKGLKSVIPF